MICYLCTHKLLKKKKKSVDETWCGVCCWWHTLLSPSISGKYILNVGITHPIVFMYILQFLPRLGVLSLFHVCGLLEDSSVVCPNIMEWSMVVRWTLWHHIISTKINPMLHKGKGEHSNVQCCSNKTVGGCLIVQSIYVTYMVVLLRPFFIINW